MMMRCIDQFHKPDVCAKACNEVENVMKELKCLALCTDMNEPIQQQGTYQRLEPVEKPMITYPIQIPRDPVPTVDREYLDARKVLEGTCLETGCECGKRNGLQDRCKKPICASAKGQPQYPQLRNPEREAAAREGRCPNIPGSQHTAAGVRHEAQGDRGARLPPCCKYGALEASQGYYVINEPMVKDPPFSSLTFDSEPREEKGKGPQPDKSAGKGKK